MVLRLKFCWPTAPIEGAAEGWFEGLSKEEKFQFLRFVSGEGHKLVAVMLDVMDERSAC